MHTHIEIELSGYCWVSYCWVCFCDAVFLSVDQEPQRRKGHVWGQRWGHSEWQNVTAQPSM